MGVSLVSFQWEKIAQNVQPNNNMVLKDGHSIKAMYIRFGNSGTYRCVKLVKAVCENIVTLTFITTTLCLER